MTSPIFGTDPKAGADYAVGEKLRSVQKNAHVDWLRSLDLTLETACACNWIYETDPAAIGGAVMGGAYSIGDALWVAVGADGAAAPAIATSHDGVHWTGQVVGAGTATYCSCACSDGVKFVAGCDDGTIRESLDGVTWNIRASGAVPILNIFYDSTNLLWIATEAGRGVSTSPDGIVWTRVALALPAAFAGISVQGGAHGNGLNVVSGFGVGVCATSTDGLTWIQRTMPAAANWYGVTYASKLARWFVMNSSTSGAVAYSDDGIVWSAQTGSVYGGGGSAPRHVACSGNVLLSDFGTGPARLMVSDDGGLSWYASGGEYTSVAAIVWGQDAAGRGGRHMVFGSTPKINVGLRLTTLGT